MVISVLLGGLGNQLFQYAFGLRLAHQLQTDLRLEPHLLESTTLARLRHYTPRQYELDTFSIHPKQASVLDLVSVLARVTVPGMKTVLVRESTTNPDAITKLPDQVQNALCFGYWQSESYFKPVAETLRKQLVFRETPSEVTLSMANTILRNPNATFIHIRRGDYVTNSTANQYHGLCDIDYYIRSISYLRERVSDPHFFVFSDDQTWAKRELSVLGQTATFVDHNQGADSWQDMYLMRLCRHAIIANSSFSWWGAWLNPETERIVIAPGQWFPGQPLLSQQVVCPNWHRL
jgi:hypothetical protein